MVLKIKTVERQVLYQKYDICKIPATNYYSNKNFITECGNGVLDTIHE